MIPLCVTLTLSLMSWDLFLPFLCVHLAASFPVMPLWTCACMNLVTRFISTMVLGFGSLCFCVNLSVMHFRISLLLFLSYPCVWTWPSVWWSRICLYYPSCHMCVNPTMFHPVLGFVRFCSCRTFLCESDDMFCSQWRSWVFRCACILSLPPPLSLSPLSLSLYLLISPFVVHAHENTWEHKLNFYMCTYVTAVCIYMYPRTESHTCALHV